MKPLIQPITRENFPESWQAVDTIRRTAKRKHAIAKVPSFFSNMVFAVLTLIVANGLVHTHLEGSYCDFLEEIPYFIPVWEMISGVLIKPEWSISAQIAVPLLALYVVCFLVFCLFALIVMAVYHPFKRQLPEDTEKEKASQMLSMARDARRYSLRAGASGTMLWALFFDIIQFILFAMYILIELENAETLFVLATTPIMKLLEPLTKDFTEMQLANLQSSVFTPSLMLFGIAPYFLYAMVNRIHTLSVQFLYQYKVPYSYVAEVEYYYTFADEDTEGLTEEEILARRTESAQAKRLEALEMEKLGAYGRAKELFSQAAHAGDPEAMEHYARHWLIALAKDPGRYWLERCVETGQASDQAKKMLKRLKWHLKVRTGYLKA